MRNIAVETIRDTVASLCQEANFYLGEDVRRALSQANVQEESGLGKNILAQLLENADIAKDEQVPICQDTGFALVFVEIGQEVHIVGGELEKAIHEGVAKGYQEGYLRKSMVSDPLERENTGDNTPAIIHFKVVSGDKLKITVAPKGGGSENMSAIKMLKPSDGWKGARDFVVSTVQQAGSNPCPPIVVGVGIGGTFEKAAILAKESLLRDLGSPNADPNTAKLEKELLNEINKLGIGPQGLGGRTTALAVHINTFPTHIASLPVAVNINCHATRHKQAIL
ncbi:MAG TPA: fumarate hydratase [Bacillota bacterium]|nr:fumarate hydratase [Bacillota bacterium]